MIDADRYWSERERELMKRPKCCCCLEHIQDEYCIELPDGRLFCNECEEDNARDLWFDFARDMFLRETKGDD